MYQPRNLRELLRLGLVTTILAAACEAPAAEPPAAPRRADAERAILAAAGARPAETQLRSLPIVLLAGPKDHGKNEHDYPRWQARWALLLGGKAASDEKAANLFGPDRPHPAVGEGAAGVRVIRADPWPSCRGVEGGRPGRRLLLSAVEPFAAGGGRRVPGSRRRARADPFRHLDAAKGLARGGGDRWRGWISILPPRTAPAGYCDAGAPRLPRSAGANPLAR